MHERMRIKAYIFVVIALVLLVLPIVPKARADSAKSKEYQIKAAFIYNFIKFVDWPEEKMADSNEPITIGIIGSEDFVNAFEPVIHKKVKNRNISIKYFEGYEKLKRAREEDERKWNQKMEALKTCHVLMFCICDSVRLENSSQIIKALKGSPVLTVGETAGFLESGGIINFLMEDKKVRFEINVTAAKKSKLKISSKLLRLAKRVVKEKSPQQEKG
jgi:hypothetical protein